MSLHEYHQKRHFQRTPEPKGIEHDSTGHSFVVQKHAASHLHYDFRLELDGVLKSWAVPKGPSLDPAVKRLAMQVEDHPVEYGSFEGIIPQGEYGGGTVMLWDRGEWEPIGDPREGYREGKLKFRLHGQKLHGRWMLLQIAGKAARDRNGRQWLLFKEKDEDARPMNNGDVLEELPLSAASGRDMGEIADDRDRVWGEPAEARPHDKAKGRSQKKTKTRTRVAARQQSAMPKRIDVELATRAVEAPAGDDWVHEIKFDGYRIICRIDQGTVHLLSRNHKDWTDRFRWLAETVQKLPLQQAIFDGEVVALREDGVSDFQQLQNAFRDRRGASLHYYIFDLLFLDGKDLTATPLVERKEILANLLKKAGASARIHYSEHIEGNGPSFLREVCKKRLEGIISKRRQRPYLPGRGSDWLKVKCIQSDEFVIGGYTEPAGMRQGFGALLVGYHDAKGKLIYAGKVGTGYDERTLRDLTGKLQRLASADSPFEDLSRAPRGTHWVEPALVAQVAFGGRTKEGILRHASFRGLRDDKAPQEVTREQVVPLATVLHENPEMPRSGAGRQPTPETQDTYNAVRKEYAGVRLTSPDKVLYPEEGITKVQLASYYQTVADWLLPHIADRPLVLVRCPEGRHKDCFYQKHPGVGTPANLRRIPITEKSKTEHYVVVDDVDGLISLAQVGTLEIHAWGSRADKLEQPDRLIFDLDPDTELDWGQVVTAARQVREFLQQLGLESFVKTTGGKGLHLVVPIVRRHEWDEAKTFCKLVAEAVVHADSSRYTANMAKAARRGKIFVDYLRNGRGATAIVPYSPRARAEAPVSTPLTWEELSARVHSDRYTVKNVPRRLASLKRDPWEELRSVRQGLDVPLKKLRGLVAW